MKLCFLLIGQYRSIHLVLSTITDLFHEHECIFYIALSKEEDTKFSNELRLNDLVTDPRIKQVQFIESQHTNEYKNSLNVLYKLSLLCVNITTTYDLYMIMRTDVVLNNISFIDNIIYPNTLYINDHYFNEYSKDNTEKINDTLFITNDIIMLKQFQQIYTYALANTLTYADIILYNFVLDKHITTHMIHIDYKLVLSQCNVIAIAGDSGSGKSTLLSILKPLLGLDNTVVLETDRYHKWERGDSRYKEYSHLHPYANHLCKMSEDVYNLKIGNDIYSVDYDHHTGKFTKEEHIESKKQILLCGLHSLYITSKDMIDLKIYMDTDRNVIKKWKIKRDMEERGYSLEKVLQQIEAREPDFNKYILSQKENATIIIQFYEDNDTKLQCNVIIKEPFYTKVIKYLISTYKISIINNMATITLKNTIKDIITTLNNLPSFQIRNDYYGEIQCILLLLL
jgi:uridine kinase